VERSSILGYFKFYFRFLGFKVFIFLFLSITVGFLDGMGLALFIPLLDSVSNSNVNSEALGKLRFITDFISSLGLPLTLAVLLNFMVAVFFIKGFIKFCQIYYQASLRQLFLKKVRYTLLNSLGNLSFPGFLKLDSGTIQNTLTTEVQKLFQGFAHFFQSFQSSAILVVYILLAFLANPQFAVFVALGAGLSNLLYRRIYKQTKNASFSLSKKGSDFNRLLIQCVHHFKYLKSTNLFVAYGKKLKKVIDETEMLNKKIGVFTAITQSAKEPIIVLVVVLVIQMQLKWFDVSFSSIMVSLLLFYRALSFLAAVQNSWQTFIQNIGSIYTIQGMVKDLDAHREKYGQVEMKAVQSGVSFRNVNFSFGEKKVLHDLTMDFPKNQTIALVGESGSGKSTIANILTGLLKVTDGMVLVDGTRIDDLDLPVYRNSIGYIAQDPVIFNDTLFNNVTRWEAPTEANLERFRRAIRLAHLDVFVQELPGQENALLGDNGLLISGGQKQRISIARELFKNDISMLILDEATSALDSETEKIIQENIENLHGQLTIVVIAHRLSTIKFADTIVVLDKGRKIADGNFSTLLESSPHFKRMVALQEF
jgi:ABC-type multidrug transport system fused ATPase/permease subunit